MRSYDQACGLAKALDLIGDRWSLLIVRELLIRGPCRYTDIKDGLPGIATNLLAERLDDLEASGVVIRKSLPPPSPANLFMLTEAGLALETAIQELGQWGSRQMTDRDRRKRFLAHWMVLPLRRFLRDARPKSPPKKISIRSADEEIAIVAGSGRVDVSLGPTSQPDAVVSGKAQAILRFLLGAIDDSQAAADGVRIEGDRRAVERVLGERNGATGHA